MQWLDDYPIGDMIERGWIEAGPDKPSILQALLDFLGAAVGEPRAYQQAVGLRITEAAQRKMISLGALAVWLRKGELEAQEVSTADYDADVFSAALAKIRHMTEQHPAEFIPAMSALCAEAGVAFCMVQELPKSGANGATRWLTDDRKALIQMSLRHKWADIFWFTFFHEACHLLKHRTQRRIVIEGLAADPDLAEIEAEADEFARDFPHRARGVEGFLRCWLFHGALGSRVCTVGRDSSIHSGWEAAEGKADWLQPTDLSENPLYMGIRSER